MLCELVPQLRAYQPDVDHYCDLGQEGFGLCIARHKVAKVRLDC